MIGWGRTPSTGEHVSQPDNAEIDEMCLGDVMRGERATLGKSLLDVQRELKIKASFIAAIENADPTAFDTPGFIAGYVRSYARYLDMDPDWAFAKFCRESGFETAHGMSEKASSPSFVAAKRKAAEDPFGGGAVPFMPESDPIFARVEPRAVGSVAVLCCLIAGLAYGGWSVLQEIQRVQFAPVEQTPDVASVIDPLAGGNVTATTTTRPNAEAFDRLYRPQALEVPVMTARDAPISTLDPRASRSPAALAQVDGEVASQDAISAAVASAIQVTEPDAPEVALLAVRPVWVRVRAADGAVIFEKILEAGEEYVLPSSDQPPVLRAGNSGSLYFKLAGQVYGPAGSGTATVKNVALGSTDLRDAYQVADLNSDSALAEVVNVAQAQTDQ